MKLETIYFQQNLSNRITNYCIMTDIGVNYVAKAKVARKADEPAFSITNGRAPKVNFKILELHAKFGSQSL